MVPFGMLDVFGEQVLQATTRAGELTPVFPMIVASALVSWVFITMEVIGDASEDPFERSMNDVPMNALSRTIEIDLRQMLGETELPPKEQPVDHILY
jgi:putative membrane protein